ncbi:MAG: fluoride ion transporter CrcB, partial [Burkholderiaceae bacterium]|nr:fluoride ion transporter CrcB [Burkholderiaceae bacterium]
MPQVLAICLGACVGALARWQLGLWLNPVATAGTVLPWGTLAANLIGGYLIGLCVAVFQALPQL